MLVRSVGVEAFAFVGWNEGYPSDSDGNAIEDWIAWQWDRPSSLAGEWELCLTNGAKIRGVPLGGNSDTLKWDCSSISLDVVEVDLLDVLEVKRTLVPLPAAKQDQLVLHTPRGERDYHRGWLLEVNKDGVLFEESGGANRYAWKNIFHLQLHDESALRPENANASWVTFVDGSLMRGYIAKGNSNHLRLIFENGNEVKVPLSQIFRIRRDDESILNLTNFEWGQSDWVRDTVIPRNPKLNLSVEGRPLTVKGERWPQGIGVLAPTTLRFNLGEKGVLLLQAAFDDETLDFHRLAPVVLRVTQGEEVLWEGQCGPRAPTGPFLVSIVESGELSLEVSGEFPGGHVNWLDPVLFRLQ